MLHWVNRIADRVDALAKGDAEYRELDRQRKALEPGYEALLSRLSPEDRELLLVISPNYLHFQHRALK